jgi:hypothetical protein
MVEVGSWVWIPDESEYVIPGEILAITADEITAKLENGQVTKNTKLCLLC